MRYKIDKFKMKFIILILIINIVVGCVSIQIMTEDDDTKTGVKTEVHKLDSIK